MRVGLTYDLRQDYLAAGYGEEETAEFDRPETISAIAAALAALGYEAVPIGNVQALVRHLAIGERWDLVFNIAEGLYGFGREGQVPALLDAYNIPYTFSDPLVCSLSLHKGMAKHVVRGCGLATPDFTVVAAQADIGAVALPYPLFAKPIAEGTGKGVNAASKIDDAAQLETVCTALLKHYRQPVLVETYLPGREYTVGIVGTGWAATAIGVIEVALRSDAEAHAYSYSNKEHYADLVDYRLVTGVEAIALTNFALAAWRALGCRDGGRVDLRLDQHGAPNFIEVNPLAGLHPEHSDLPILCHLCGVSYQDLIGHILNSALTRLEHAPAPILAAVV